jgi:BirA family biotin operon repressor/biotin-[acetyl-CoA-carboxylase] ligase
MDRSWVSRPGDGLTFSVRLEVPPTVAAWGWIPLLTGVAVADAVRESGAREVALKWPNDVVGGDGKVGGILAVRDGHSAIVGVGLNLQFRAARPDPQAVSVAELAGQPDADEILASITGNLHGWWSRFVQAAGDAQRCGLHTAYSGQCVTLGAEVDVAESTGRRWTGVSEGIDHEGRLLVRGPGGVRAVSAADVTLRA